MEEQTPDIVTELQEEPEKKVQPREFGKQFDESGMSYERKGMRVILWAFVLVVAVAGLAAFLIQSGVAQQLLGKNAQNQGNDAESVSTSSATSDSLPGARDFGDSSAEEVKSDLESDLNQIDEILDEADLYDSPNWELEFGWESGTTSSK